MKTSMKGMGSTLMSLSQVLMQAAAANVNDGVEDALKVLICRYKGSSQGQHSKIEHPATARALVEGSIGSGRLCRIYTAHLSSKQAL